MPASETREPTGAKVRLVLVEDEPLFRDLLRTVLAQHPRLEVVAAFGDGAAALAAAPRLRPQVALLDIELGGDPHGVEVGLRLRRALPGIGIVLLSNHADPQFVASLPREEVAGWSYLLKKSVGDADVLARAVAAAAVGRAVLDPRLVASLRPRVGSPLARLTPRQYEILGLVAQGLTNAAIGRRLSLAEKSVENQLSLVYQQLGIDRANGGVHPRVSAALDFLRESRPGGPAPGGG